MLHLHGVAPMNKGPPPFSTHSHEASVLPSAVTVKVLAVSWQGVGAAEGCGVGHPFPLPPLEGADFEKLCEK